MRGLPDRGDDVYVAAAAAEVAAHPLADLVVVFRVSLAQQCRRGAELPRRAVTALEGVVADEGGLQRVQPVRTRESLDGNDLPPAVRDREGDGGADQERAPRRIGRRLILVGRDVAGRRSHGPWSCSRRSSGNAEAVSLTLLRLIP